VGYTDVILSQPPKGGGYIDCKNKVGHLLVFLGTHTITTEPDTMSKVPGATREVATVDYVDLDDGQGGIIQWGARVDKIGIVNKLRGQRNAIMGRLVLGDAKQGMSAPFILEDHTPADADRFLNVWMPANRAALAGAEQQQPQQAPAVQQAPAPQYQVPQSQYQAPVPAAPQASSPWAAPAPQAQPQYAQQVMPQPQAAQPQPTAADLTNGQTGAYTPEAMAAIERMIAAGQLPGFPQPTH
jgi:hypothetical protein